MLLEVNVNGGEMDHGICSNWREALSDCKKHNLTALMAEVLDRTDVDKRSPIYQRWSDGKESGCLQECFDGC